MWRIGLPLDRLNFPEIESLEAAELIGPKVTIVTLRTKPNTNNVAEESDAEMNFLFSKEKSCPGKESRGGIPTVTISLCVHVSDRAEGNMRSRSVRNLCCEDMTRRATKTHIEVGPTPRHDPKLSGSFCLGQNGHKSRANACPQTEGRLFVVRRRLILGPNLGRICVEMDNTPTRAHVIS